LEDKAAGSGTAQAGQFGLAKSLKGSRINREQCREFATRIQTEIMVGIAFHAGLFCYSRLSGQVRSGIYQGSVPLIHINTSK